MKIRLNDVFVSLNIEIFTIKIFGKKQKKNRK